MLQDKHQELSLGDSRKGGGRGAQQEEYGVVWFAVLVHNDAAGSAPRHYVWRKRRMAGERKGRAGKRRRATAGGTQGSLDCSHGQELDVTACIDRSSTLSSVAN